MYIEYGPLSTEMYQRTKPVGTSLDGDLEYYEKKLSSCNGKVLEAGVGNGRLLIPLAQQGIAMVGVDLSSDMLSACKENCEAAGVAVPLYQQDLQHLELPYKFDAIIMPAGSFALIPGRKAAKAVLENFLHHLAPGGRVIIDLELPVNFRLGEIVTAEVPLEAENGILFTSTSLAMDWEQQKTTYLHRYEHWRRGELLQSELSNFVLHWYGLEEFKSLLLQTGFASVQMEFDYGNSENYRTKVTYLAR